MEQKPIAVKVKLLISNNQSEKNKHELRNSCLKNNIIDLKSNYVLCK